MKLRRNHRVPLCGRALEILAAARTLDAGRSPLVFPGKGGKRLADKTLRQPLHRLRIAAVVHGFRSSFRDWACVDASVNASFFFGWFGACGQVLSCVRPH